MKPSPFKSYFAAGVTAFCVIAAAILFFFLFFHASTVTSFLVMIARILRPIFMGMVLAFLLLPIHSEHRFTAAKERRVLKGTQVPHDANKPKL